MLKLKDLSLNSMEISNNPIDEKTTNYIYSVIYPNALNKIKLDIFDILHVNKNIIFSI